MGSNPTAAFLLPLVKTINSELLTRLFCPSTKEIKILCRNEREGFPHPALRRYPRNGLRLYYSSRLLVLKVVKFFVVENSEACLLYDLLGIGVFQVLYLEAAYARFMRLENEAIRINDVNTVLGQGGR